MMLKLNKMVITEDDNHNGEKNLVRLSSLLIDLNSFPTPRQETEHIYGHSPLVLMMSNLVLYLTGNADLGIWSYCYTGRSS